MKVWKEPIMVLSGRDLNVLIRSYVTAQYFTK